MLEWSDITEYFGETPVLHPNSVVHCLQPKELWESALNKKGSDLLHEPVIKGFHNFIVLRGVVCGEATLSPLLSEEVGEGTTGIFAPTVRAKSFNFHPMLGCCPGHKGLVSIKHLIFGVKGGKHCISGVIICERNIVFPPPQTGNRAWPP